MPKMPIQIDVNDVNYDLLVEPDRSLVDALRDDLGLTGTKRACNEGECASCAVHLDGKIVDAIMAASGQPRQRQDPPSQYRVVGRSLPRTDSLEKVTGRAPYAYDMRLAGMVYGEILRSPHAHARIKKVDPSRAEAMP